MSLLELENVVTAYGKVEALKGLTLRVEQGEIVALLGSNGAGKSTTLRTISGLVRPLSGTMRFLGQPIDRLSPEAIVKLGVAHVPEHRRVFPGLTVRENILLGGSNRVRASRRELETDAEQMLAVFPELKPFANVLGWKLSGGQQQMLAIARGADGPTQTSSPRRAVARSCAANRPAGFSDYRWNPRTGYNRATGGTECPYGTLDRRSRLRA